MSDRRITKRGRANRAASSSQPPPEPEVPFERYQEVILARPLNPERTMVNLNASPSFKEGIQFYGLEGLLEVTTRRNEQLVYQYHIAYASTHSPTFILRSTPIPEVTPDTFAEMYGLRLEPNCVFTRALNSPYPKEAVEEALTYPGLAKWKAKCDLDRNGTHHMTKNWQNFLATNVLPVKHRSSLRKKMSLLIYLIMRREPLCFPTIMCQEFHSNVKDFKLTPGPRYAPSAIGFPHFVSAFCALHHVPIRGMDYYNIANSYQIKEDQNMADFPPQQPLDFDDIFGEIPSPPPQQQQQQPGLSTEQREIPLDDEFLSGLHEEVHGKVIEDLIQGQKEIREELKELRSDVNELKGGVRALLRHFHVVIAEDQPEPIPSTSVRRGGNEDEDEGSDD